MMMSRMLPLLLLLLGYTVYDSDSGLSASCFLIGVLFPCSRVSTTTLKIPLADERASSGRSPDSHIHISDPASPATYYIDSPTLYSSVVLVLDHDVYHYHHSPSLASSVLFPTCSSHLLLAQAS